jgi:hypothetical protein
MVECFRVGKEKESDPAQQCQDQDNDQHQTQCSRRVITPAGAVGPSRPRTQQKQKKYDDQNGSKHGFKFLPQSENQSLPENSLAQVKFLREGGAGTQEPRYRKAVSAFGNKAAGPSSVSHDRRRSIA